MAEYKVTDTELTSVADAIRTKGGTSSGLSFPDGFSSAIENIPTSGGGTLITKSITANGTYNATDDNADGYSSVSVLVDCAECYSGTFTAPSSGSTYELTFDRTFNNYLAIIEATNETKASIVNSGLNASKGFAFICVYPKRSANNETVANNTLVQRINPSTSAVDAATAAALTCSSTGIEFVLGDFSGGVNLVYRNCTYKFCVVAIT